MDGRVLLGAAVYCVALVCAPYAFGEHRHPLLAAHCRTRHISHASKHEIQALDRMMLRSVIFRWLAIPVISYPNLPMAAAFAGIEVVLVLLWGAVHWRMVQKRNARLARGAARRQTA